MLTKEDARALVIAEIERPSPDQHASDPTDTVIVDEHTIEKEWGWVFFYNSDRYLKTREVRYALAGNAPYIVNRRTGDVRVTGTAHPIEHYIAEYERELADIAGWRFVINEVSLGVYEVLARDNRGRSFQAQGVDAEVLLQRARQYAAFIADPTERDSHGSGGS